MPIHLLEVGQIEVAAVGEEHIVFETGGLWQKILFAVGIEILMRCFFGNFDTIALKSRS